MKDNNIIRDVLNSSITKKKAILFALALLSASAFAGKDVTYVGGGRYYCSNNSTRCAQVRQNNDALEEAKAARDEARQERAEREEERIFRSTVPRHDSDSTRSHRYDSDDADDD